MVCCQKQVLTNQNQNRDMPHALFPALDKIRALIGALYFTCLACGWSSGNWALPPYNVLTILEGNKDSSANKPVLYKVKSWVKTFVPLCFFVKQNQ